MSWISVDENSICLNVGRGWSLDFDAGCHKARILTFSISPSLRRRRYDLTLFSSHQIWRKWVSSWQFILPSSIRRVFFTATVFSRSYYCPLPSIAAFLCPFSERQTHSFVIVQKSKEHCCEGTLWDTLEFTILPPCFLRLEEDMFRRSSLEIRQC